MSLPRRTCCVKAVRLACRVVGSRRWLCLAKIDAITSPNNNFILSSRLTSTRTRHVCDNHLPLVLRFYDPLLPAQRPANPSGSTFISCHSSGHYIVPREARTATRPHCHSLGLLILDMQIISTCNQSIQNISLPWREECSRAVQNFPYLHLRLPSSQESSAGPCPEAASATACLAQRISGQTNDIRLQSCRIRHSDGHVQPCFDKLSACLSVSFRAAGPLCLPLSFLGRCPSAFPAPLDVIFRYQSPVRDPIMESFRTGQVRQQRWRIGSVPESRQHTWLDTGPREVQS
ncbi:hypothetical protein P171DRAFT_274816 [Karstenula rhodostoma CBS 690.94]|uniref:Uncharacterized protein n=1 Tax=Karstenula rhodostoma CBS 690.94 TaxID=1392251 RepID=A0A9P4PKY6_9PLEO|nr:hypothetical protein P171DRAFT_274816 [Karstenula rhodostoma CBS 690.94]